MINYKDDNIHKLRSEARRNQTSILIRGRENHVSTQKLMDRQTDIRAEIRTDISIYRVASLLIIQLPATPFKDLIHK